MILTWVGQAGFLVEYGGTRLLIDPFFGEHEAHLDHLDPVSLRAVAERSPGVVVIAPQPLRDMVEGLPFEGVRPGDRLELPGDAFYPRATRSPISVCWPASTASRSTWRCRR
jgi:L-ascorbate metabolism protein UlaG (beta-lactamase superfamily)